VSRRTLLIAIAVLAFLAISLLLARWLTTENTERSAIHDLLVAQAAGDADAMLDVLDPACREDAACAREAAANAERLEREGEPKILSLRSDTAYALGEATGATRVAWAITDDGDGLPVVQCVEVRREGSAISGRTVTLLRISAPIGNEASC
jgi:hypothetical protein